MHRLRSRKTSPSRRCYDRGGVTGCSTVGWQDHVELAPLVRREMRLDASFASTVQRLFKQHARAMPGFLGSGYDLITSAGQVDPGLELIITTECSTGNPSWDLHRPGDFRAEQCNLWTIITVQ